MPRAGSRRQARRAVEPERRTGIGRRLWHQAKLPQLRYSTGRTQLHWRSGVVAMVGRIMAMKMAEGLVVGRIIFVIM